MLTSLHRLALVFSESRPGRPIRRAGVVASGWWKRRSGRSHNAEPQRSGAFDHPVVNRRAFACMGGLATATLLAATVSSEP